MSKKKASSKTKRKSGSKSKPDPAKSTTSPLHGQTRTTDPDVAVAISELVSRLLIHGPKPLAIIQAAVQVKYFQDLAMTQSVFSELFESWICDESPLIGVDVVHGEVTLSIKSVAENSGESRALDTVEKAEPVSIESGDVNADSEERSPTESTGPVTATAMFHDAATQSSGEEIFRQIVDARLRHVKSIPITEARWRVEEHPQFPAGAFFQVLASLLQARVYRRIPNSQPPSICKY